jgi:DNA-binding transcriptional ArsR family regulator
MDNKLIPNSTQTPNIVYDLLVPRLSEAEARCTLYICRRIFGFHKDEVRISFSQVERGIKRNNGEILDYGAGLSRPAISEALKNLSKAKAIFIEKNSKGNIYKINLEMNVEEVVSEVNQLRKLTNIGKATLPKPVKLPYLQNKGKQRETKVNASGFKKPSAHTQFIDFFFDSCRKVRKVKPIITGKDGKNLKRVLDLNIVSEQELEQIALYFLSDRYYRKFAPSISTFLSSGIINGLVDSLKNRETFWKELEGYLEKYTDSEVIRSDDLALRLTKIKTFNNKFIPSNL